MVMSAALALTVLSAIALDTTTNIRVRIIASVVVWAVIASAAKQSIARQQERMDCFVALLLAMTGEG
jgi:hypothetical protein